MNIRLLPLMLAIAFTFDALAAPPSVEHAKEAARLAYEGHEAIEDKEWLTAAGNFRALERLQRKANEPADASLYWQAYALSQAKRDSEVKEIVERLLKLYPESAWADDARALVHQSQPSKAVSEATREEDALMALDALLASSSERAVPILKKVLASGHSEKVKARAMFVLTQIDSEEASAALGAILTGSGSKKLKAEAIRMLATGAKSSALDQLVPIYRGNDEELREAVIEAFIIGDRGDLLRQIAERERDVKMRRRAIDAMGAVGDRPALVGLFNATKDESTQLQVLNALGVAGAEKELAAIARGDVSIKVKTQAIRSMGIAGGKEVSELIASFYYDRDPMVRRAVIDALITCDGGKQLAKLYRAETNRELKRQLLQAIGAVGDEETLDLIEESLER